MRKKIGMWLLAGFLLLQSAVQVHATPDDNSVVKAVSGYCLSDELYAFIQLKDGYDADSYKVNLQSDVVSAAGEQSIVPVTDPDTSVSVRYVFMVDQSVSMSNYKEEVNAFVDSLVEMEKLQAYYTVAVFGDRFKIVSDNLLTDGNAVKRELAELQYTEQWTDPYTGVESALTYLDGCSRKSGDLIHLIMITDGKPDLGGEKSQTKESAMAESVAQRIKNTPEVIVSTICTAQWDARAFQALSTGSGIHETINGNLDAGAAGEKMANYVDSLYRVNFKLSEMANVERFSVQLWLKGNDLMSVSLEGVPNLKLFSNGTQENPDGEKPEIGDIKEPGDEDVKEPEGEDVNGLETTEIAAGSEPEEAGQGIDKKLILAAGASALVILAGICVILLMRKQNSRKTGLQSKVREGATGGIMMKLEVYSGNCVSRSTTMRLADSLVIGSAPDCDLVFNDPDVSPRNSRIFVYNQMIYIEDMNSAEGTALGGMRIQGQNRLRSGDVISIGNVEFCFKF